MTDKPSSSTRRWSQKTGLLAFMAGLTVIVMSTCSYLVWNMYWSPEAIARKARAKKVSKPRWSELSATQRDALAPLAGEWDHISTSGKKTWLIMADRIALQSPEEKARAQKRIQDWVKLTPEQRRTIRANYALAKKKLAPNEKMAKWQNYQQLTEEQRKELAATMPSKNQAVTPTAPSSQEEKIARSLNAAPDNEPAKSVQPSSTESSAPIAPPATAPAQTPAAPEAAPV